ncbi:MAG: hypothetical protein COU35_02680 [Candidatus Magasanikbacteria bacterium CG10_big_fil_rev_8_21_14_0_10_47_10]|uniref:Amino acid transporter transmembrane domain-containing protein n=1 Tax=Candidatus Magasanikbacteria bacterium CG10_big_fil_rev_8_21_14_0_10_47_10 TaxID=1974652 RepID=A0A2H0TQB0_9BACT|nr:MAG: hypothetical protein COU35_02680 [Candidatus Magasanikbacteria bacterium CG10_big_fil_rev_8_21_14_0_10_47_10]
MSIHGIQKLCYTKRMKSSHLSSADVAEHYGFFRKKLSLWEGVALIVSGTIGAGVLGIPFVIAKVGAVVGFFYIIAVGFIMMSLNMLLAQVTVQTGKRFQLVGLAEEYLGKPGKIIMTTLFYSMLIGVMVIYIIGEGQALAAMFNGNPFTWSILFFALGSVLILFGLRTVKTVEVLLVLSILFVVFLIVRWSAPHIQVTNIQYQNLASLLLPYGVLLFAFHGASSIPEAHSLLENKEKTFKKAIVYSSLILILIYALFAFVVVGVTGGDTTEVATIGLGAIVGPRMVLFGNLFAALAMGTGFLLTGVILSDSLQWDFKLPRFLSNMVVTLLPLIIFLFGVRGFIATMDIIGGVFISLEMVLILAIYWRSKQRGDLRSHRFGLHHAAWLFKVVVLALLVGSVYSVSKFFGN